MGNPYAARGPVRVASEQVSELAGFLDRLTRLGATPDELETVAEGWDDFDEDWTPDRRAEFIRLSDEELRAAIAGVREEWEYAPTSEAEAEAAKRDATYAAALADAATIIGRTVAEVVEWVAGDKARAAAVTELESGPDGGGRKTLLGALSELDAVWRLELDELNAAWRVGA